MGWAIDWQAQQRQLTPSTCTATSIVCHTQLTITAAAGMMVGPPTVDCPLLPCMPLRPPMPVKLPPARCCCCCCGCRAVLAPAAALLPPVRLAGRSCALMGFEKEMRKVPMPSCWVPSRARYALQREWRRGWGSNDPISPIHQR